MDLRYTNDMQPDKDIIRELYQLDKYLKVYWNNDSRRWEIWRCKTVPVRVVTLEYDDGSYKPLTRELIRTLQSWDRHHAAKATDLLSEMDQRNKELRLREKAERKDNFKQLTKDCRSLIRKMAGDSAVGNWRGANIA